MTIGLPRLNATSTRRRSAEYEPVAERLGHEVRARASARLQHRVVHVRADGVVADLKLVGDLRAGLAERDQAHDLELAL